jgi:hypothetical protein
VALRRYAGIMTLLVSYAASFRSRVAFVLSSVHPAPPLPSTMIVLFYLSHVLPPVQRLGLGLTRTLYLLVLTFKDVSVLVKGEKYTMQVEMPLVRWWGVVIYGAQRISCRKMSFLAILPALYPRSRRFQRHKHSVGFRGVEGPHQ